jgi:hypothetical protein
MKLSEVPSGSVIRVTGVVTGPDGDPYRFVDQSSQPHHGSGVLIESETEVEVLGRERWYGGERVPSNHRLEIRNLDD